MARLACEPAGSEPTDPTRQGWWIMKTTKGSLRRAALAAALALLACCALASSSASAAPTVALGAPPVLASVLSAAHASKPAPPAVGSGVNCAAGAKPSECPWYDTPTIFVHGYGLEIPFTPTYAVSCSTYWGKTEGALARLALAGEQRSAEKRIPEMVTVGYYSTDYNCSANIGEDAPGGCCRLQRGFQDHDTSIAVLGYELRRFIWRRYGSRPVNIVAHSMGGLITRTAFSAGEYNGLEAGPECPTLCLTQPEHIKLSKAGSTPNIGHVVTLGTPHEGITPPISLGPGWEASGEMVAGSEFMRWLGGQSYRSPAGTTWTAIGVGGTFGGDGVVAEGSALVLDGTAGSFNPDLRVDYWEGQGYNHLNENEGTEGWPSDSACEGDPSSSGALPACFNVKFAQGGSTAFTENSNGTFPGIRKMVMYGLEGSLPPPTPAPSITGVSPPPGGYRGLVGGLPFQIHGHALGAFQGERGEAYYVELEDNGTRWGGPGTANPLQCRPVILAQSNQLIECQAPTSPRLTDGSTATVQIVTGDGSSGQFRFAVEGTVPTIEPTVESFTPARAPVGAQVTINGKHFGSSQLATSAVTMLDCYRVNGNTTCSRWGNGALREEHTLTIDSWSDEHIFVTVPSGAAPGSFDEVTVITAAGSSYPRGFEVLAPPPAAPTVTAIAPTFGYTNGGTPVTITGTNLKGASAVRFGSVAASSFRIVSETEIEADSPPNSSGSVDVTVTTAGGTSATSAADQFLYITQPPPPTSGTVYVGLHDQYFAYEGPASTATGAGAWNYTTCNYAGWSGNTMIMSGVWTSQPDSSEAWAAGVGTTNSTMWWTAGIGVLQPETNYAVYADVDTCNASTTSAWYTLAGNDGQRSFAAGDTGQMNMDINQATSSGYVYLGTENTGYAGVTVALVNGGANQRVGAADIKLVPLGGGPSAPVVGSISPSSGETSGGNSVTISGTGLANASAVYFGSTRATITSDGQSSITATAPAESAGTVDVTVTAAGLTSAVSASDRYTYLNPPPAHPTGVYIGLRDNYGASGGPQVTLTGETGLWHQTTCSAGGWTGAFDSFEPSTGAWSILNDNSEWWAYGKSNPTTATVWWTAGMGILSPDAEYKIYADVDSCNASTSSAYYTIGGEDGEASFSNASGVQTVRVDQETATGYVYLGTETTSETRGITVALVNGGADQLVGASDIKLLRVASCIHLPCPF